MAPPVALRAPCVAIYSGILSAVNKQYRDSFFNQGAGQIWVATMGHFSVAISTKWTNIQYECVFLRKLPPNPEITLPLYPSSNTLVDSNTKVAGLRQLFV